MADKLTSNVAISDPETGKVTWYGPSYPQNGEPPEGAVTNPAAFAPTMVEAGDLSIRRDDLAAADVIDDADADLPDLSGFEIAPGTQSFAPTAPVAGGDDMPKRNAGRDEWAAYADARGVQYEDGAGRDAIRDAVDASR